MEAFLNLTFFVGVFYLLIVLAGLPGRSRHRGGADVESGEGTKRVA